MTLKIYGIGASRAARPIWTALELGVPFELISTPYAGGATRKPEFLAINPAAQVPCLLLSDGRMLAQSNAIIMHLAEGSRLIPTDAYDRAKMLEWMFWEQYSHEPYIAVVRFQRHMAGLPADAIEPKLVQRGYAALDRMELALTTRPYLVGQDASLADMALVAYTRLAHQGGFDLEAYPHIRAWVSRVEADFKISD
jgi:glutathione S-transferase